MPQSNSILNLLNITDENITVFNCTDKIIHKGKRKKRIKIIDGRLSYSLSKCPNCGFSSLIKNGTRQTDIRLSSINGCEYHLKLSKQRYLCKSCGATCGAHTNLVSPNQSMSHQVEQAIIPLAKQSLTQKAIGEIVGVSSSTVGRILYGSQKLPKRIHKLPTNICMDEFRSSNHLFSLVTCDADTHELMTLLPSRVSSKVIEHFLAEYSLQERQQVQSVTIDLNANYQNVIHRLFPKAVIVIDRFHVIQLIGRALDKARVSALNSIDDKRSREYKALKPNWKMFHLFDEELNASDIRYIFGINEYMTEQNLVDIGLNVDAVFNEIYQTYQNILRSIRHKDFKLLRQTLKNYRKTNTSMDTVITTFKKNLKYIENSCKLRYSNGPIEGLIGKIKKLKHNCYGFRNLEHFFKRIRLILA